MQDNFQERKVLKALKKQPLTMAQIARACKNTRGQYGNLMRRLTSMVEKNMIIRDGRVYSLPKS